MFPTVLYSLDLRGGNVDGLNGWHYLKRMSMVGDWILFQSDSVKYLAEKPSQSKIKLILRNFQFYFKK